MASKQSRRGQRILSARKASQWDENRIKHFKESQRHRHDWIQFAEIAKEYSERGGPPRPKKAAAALDEAYTILEDDLLAGYFEERGRSRVRFVFPGVSWTHGYMTRKWLKDAIDNDWDGRRGRSYLENCWLPRELFRRWREMHHLPEAPRFEPQDNYVVTPTHLPPSNKGGRPPKVEWDALKDALREEIKIYGFPDPQKPPGWRGTKDVVEWAFEKLGRTERDVSPRTVAYHVRKMLVELAAAAKPVSR